MTVEQLDELCVKRASIAAKEAIQATLATVADSITEDTTNLFIATVPIENENILQLLSYYNALLNRQVTTLNDEVTAIID